MDDSKKDIRYSIVIPVYNSEKTLEELTQRLSDTMNSITEKYEIVLIDDCSSDNSWSKLKELRNKNKKLKIIHLQKNFGQDGAVLCGLNHAIGDYIITGVKGEQYPCKPDIFLMTYEPVVDKTSEGEI